MEQYHVGQAVKVHAFGRWYDGTVAKVGRTRVHVTYASGTGTVRTKAVGPDKVKPALDMPAGLANKVTEHCQCGHGRIDHAGFAGHDHCTACVPSPAQLTLRGFVCEPGRCDRYTWSPR